MPRNNAAATASEMLSGLKSRLGFSHNDDEDFSRYDADFNDYDDFDDDGYSPRNDREYAGYGSDYDESAPVGAYRPTTAGPGRYGRGDSSPNLVSIEDVKARTQLPDTLMRDPLANTGGSASSRAKGTRSSNRELIGPSGPAPSSPAHTASLREMQSRSEGLNSLFEPTSDSADRSSAATSRQSVSAGEAYSSRSAAVSRPSSRGLTVIKPVAYNDVEGIAKALKAGDVVVLGMRNTPGDLLRRVLDFSFGVASALDASVESPGDKVFAIARGTALSAEEKARLRNQGVL